MTFKALLAAGAAAAALLTAPLQASAADKLLNASYDIARELFVEVNTAFIADYKAKTGKDVSIDQSHAGSSKQARAILEGMEADVVTFNQTTDINALVKGGAVS
ncbi:MAG: substrate-binding domain-containing protein, partial [Pannonibacter indicus]